MGQGVEGVRCLFDQQGSFVYALRFTRARGGSTYDGVFAANGGWRQPGEGWGSFVYALRFTRARGGSTYGVFAANGGWPQPGEGWVWGLLSTHCALHAREAARPMGSSPPTAAGDGSFVYALRFTRARGGSTYGVFAANGGWRQPGEGLCGVCALRFFRLAQSCLLAGGRRAARRFLKSRKTRRLPTSRPCAKSIYEESRFQRTTTRQQLDCAKTCLIAKTSCSGSPVAR
jgi:hypothetical protein